MFRIRLKYLLIVMLRATWLIVGGVIGASVVLLLDASSELLLNTAVYWGIAIGIAFCVFAMFAVSLLRPREMEAPKKPLHTDYSQASKAIHQVIEKLGVSTDTAENLTMIAQHQAKSVLALILRLWSGAAAIGTAIAIVGSVIAMVTALAAIRQVNRIDAQNALLETQNILTETQIAESRQNRVAATFAAQLPSLLEAIDSEGKTHEALWIPSASLARRIQALIDSSEPVFRDESVDRAIVALNQETSRITNDLNKLAEFKRWPIPEMRFSPQRALLLRLLVEARIDLAAVEPPFDFSRSDFRGFRFRQHHSVSTVDLGETNLSQSNFLGSDLLALNLSTANLRDSALPRIDRLYVKMSPERIRFDNSEDSAAARTIFFRGKRQHSFSSLEGSLLLLEPDPDLKRSAGLIGNHFISERCCDTIWLPPDAIEYFVERADEATVSSLRLFPTYYDSAAYYDIVASSFVDNRRVFRFGRASPLQWIEQAITRLPRIEASEDIDCGDLESQALEELRDLYWFTQNNNVHPKWQRIYEIAYFSLTPPVVDCIQDIGDEERELPEMARAFVSPDPD